MVTVQEDEQVSLRFRSEEIQKLINLYQPAALHAMEEHHPVQQKARNSQQHVMLQPGTTINLKAEWLLNKLEPRYRGPYSIYGQDKKVNNQSQKLTRYSAQNR